MALSNEVKAGEQTVSSSGRTPLTIPEAEQTQKEATSSSFYTTSRLHGAKGFVDQWCNNFAAAF